MIRAKSLTLLAIAFAAPAAASERGGEAYPNGADTQRVAALPPPGWYLLTYTTYYTADRMNDANGDRLAIPMKIDAEAQIFRAVHIAPFKVLGATWAQQALVPFANVRARIGGAGNTTTGVGDIIVNPLILSWSVGKNAHIVAGMDTFIPTGRFKASKLANLGRNYWTFQPIIAYTYFNPAGGPELTVKLMYDFNTRNKATDYTTGQTFHTDVSAGYDIGKLMIGVTGYYSRQLKDDRQYGLSVGPNGNREELFAIGPTVRYQVGHVPVTAEWQHEFVAHNRPMGERFWIKAAFRL